jgi:DNA-binding winged helix-turn-helix (wHTH) protein
MMSVGEWQIFPELLRMRRGDDVLEVEPRVMAVLEELARVPGRVVTRDDLYRTVWSDVIVSDDALNRCIRELRRLLGDDARSPRFIETISKRGYRLIAPVERSAEALLPDAVKPIVDVQIAGTTLFGHRAELPLRDLENTIVHRENVVLIATVDETAKRIDIRTRTLAAATPLLTAFGAPAITALFLCGRGFQTGHVVAVVLAAAAAGWFAGLPARRRALDRSRAAIAAFSRTRIGSPLASIVEP